MSLEKPSDLCILYKIEQNNYLSKVVIMTSLLKYKYKSRIKFIKNYNLMSVKIAPGHFLFTFACKNFIHNEKN